jgi:hypothetical protein
MKKVVFLFLFFCFSNLEAQVPDYKQFQALQDKLKLMKRKSKGDTISEYRLLFVHTIDGEYSGDLNFGYSPLHELAPNDFENLPGYFPPIHYLKTWYYGNKYKVTREVECDNYRDQNYHSTIDTGDDKVVIYRYFEKVEPGINEDSLQAVYLQKEKSLNEFMQRYYSLEMERDSVVSLLRDSLNSNYQEHHEALKDSAYALEGRIGVMQQQHDFENDYYKTKAEMDSINYGELNVLCEEIRKYPCDRFSQTKFDSTGKYQLLFAEYNETDYNYLEDNNDWSYNFGGPMFLNSSIVRGNSKIISGKEAMKNAQSDRIKYSEIAFYDYGNKYMVISVFREHVEHLQDDALTMTSYIGLATYYYKKVE